MSEPVRLSLVEARIVPSGFAPTKRTRDVAPPLEATTPDDYARGFADGQHAASDRFTASRAAMAALLASARALQPEPSEELAAMIALTVERLVVDLVGAAPVSSSEIAARAARATALIGDADNARTLWLNPDDLASVDGLDLGLAAMADPALARGAVRIDCSTGWIEDGRSIYLDALRIELGAGDAR